MQLNSWHADLCAMLGARGFRVIRFDNRDVGRSTRSSAPLPEPWRLLTGRFDPRQYTLSDKARDAVGLLAGLELEAAHLVGVSMGGMIAQTVAAQYPQHVLTLTSIMSTTGSRRAGQPAPSTMRRLLARPVTERDAAVARTVETFRHIGSRGFPFEEEQVRTVALEAFDRGGGANSKGVARQLAAIVKSRDRTAELRRIVAPTLVIHGDRDRMVDPSGGAATASAIPGARLHTIAGMGHDLPRGAWPELVELIAAHAVERAVEAR
jgi:pimeloyl-ACP methyl ester carboxylesterase